MSSNPFDVLATVFLWVCFCILSSVAYVSLSGGEEPAAPRSTISHHHVEPQVVLPPPLWSRDLPPPRELPPQATFEPRPQPDPLPRQRNGLIPRAERRVRPAVLPERQAQRKRPLAEMSTRERVAAAAEEAAQEAYEARKEQELLWRRKAVAHQEAEAERTREAASGTRGGRKQLGIDLEAATCRPGETQDVEIERPPYEGSNAFTGTALGDESGSASAPPMEIEEAGTAAKPPTGEMQDSAPVTSENTTTTVEKPQQNPLIGLDDETAREMLAHGLKNLADRKAIGRDPSWDSDLLTVYAFWGEWVTRFDTVVWDKERLREVDIVGLKVVIGEEYENINKRYGKSSSGELAHVLSVITDLGRRMVQAYPQLNVEAPDQHVAPDQQAPEYSEIMIDDQHVAPDQQDPEYSQIMIDDQSVAGEQLYREQQIASDYEYAVSLQKQDEDTLMDQQTDMQDHPETAIPSSSGAAPSYVQNGQTGPQINVPGPESPSRSWVDLQHLETATFPRSQEQPSVPHVQSDQRSIHEEEMQASLDTAQKQSQQRPQTPPAVEDEENLYGTSPHAEAKFEADTSSGEISLETAESDAADEVISVASSGDLAAQIHAEMDKKDEEPDSAVQQQTTTEAAFVSEDVQKRHRDEMQSARAQAEAHLPVAAAQKAEYEAAQAAREKSRSIAETKHVKTDEAQFMSNAVQKRHQFQSRKDREKAEAAIAEAKEADAETRSAPVDETNKPEEVAQENALDHGWEMSDIKLESGVYPLQGNVTLNEALVLLTAWLHLNNALVSTLQKQFRPSEYKIRATTMPHGQHFMAKIKQMSSRYRQLKQYTCVKIAGTEQFDWDVEKISLKDINKHGLGKLISKDKEFLTTLKDAFATLDGADKSRQAAIDESRKVVLEAYANVMAVSHAIARIPSPSGSSDNDDTDSDADYYRDATPAVKAAHKKDLAEQKASRPDTRTPAVRPS